MKTCKQCSDSFEVNEWDRAFYRKVAPEFAGKKFAIPEPTLCPLCRAQRRYLWRAELNLFKRKSAFSGKDIVTFFPPESDVKVYSTEEWWSDDWDALSYGRDFDFSRPFFEQFYELLREVPLLALSGQFNEENSDYVNNASWNKNCYLIAGANYNEDCYYGNYINRCRSCVDNNFVDSCELCYDCVDCTGCYRTLYSQNSHNCSESYFLKNCRNCQNCFGCVNLVGQEYCFFNEQLSKADYQARLAGMELHRRSKVEEARLACERHGLNYPNKFMLGEMNDEVTGNAVHSSREAFDCFDVSDVWDCKHCHWLHKSKTCMDILAWGFSAELCYECMEAGYDSYHVLFSASSYGAQETLYSFYTMHSKHCFGCVSMKKKEYCIFNKQYSPEEYEKMVARIIEHMRQTGEWGEFFPIKGSPLCYNTTIAQDYFPMEQQAAESLGWSWHDHAAVEQRASENVLVPDSIDDADPAICQKILTCKKTGRPFKVTRQEFAFYKENRIPLPDIRFNARHEARLQKRNPRQLWDRNCTKCNAELVTSYPPYRPDIVYCEQCYLDEVY